MIAGAPFAAWLAHAAEVDVALDQLRCLAESVGADAHEVVARAVRLSREAGLDSLAAIDHVRDELLERVLS